MGSGGASNNRSPCLVLADDDKIFRGQSGTVGTVGTGVSASDCLKSG